MGEFQSYIMDKDKDLLTKMDIIYRLQKLLKERRGETIFFDKSVIFKTEIARMFIEYMNLDVDKDLVLTACLLCNCKKVDNAQKIGKLHTYAKEGADYLLNIGFDPRFCRICEGVNRYSDTRPREPESDILELTDQFGGMLIDRPERIAFNPDEAMVLLEHRNLKTEYNRYLQSFREFVEAMEKIVIHGNVDTTVFARLQKLMRDSKGVPELVKSIATDYSICVDQKLEELKTTAKEAKKTANRAMFTTEIEEKILNHAKMDDK